MARKVRDLIRDLKRAGFVDRGGKRSHGNFVHPKVAKPVTMAMNEKAQYYPREALSLREDVSGARMWAVALEKTMLTYFEVEPNSRFDKHSHESEQITMVIEGELFFELRERTISVKQGEVIAIPSCVHHAVYTKDKSVKAVDAWSPVMERYSK